MYIYIPIIYILSPRYNLVFFWDYRNVKFNSVSVECSDRSTSTKSCQFLLNFVIRRTVP